MFKYINQILAKSHFSFADCPEVVFTVRCKIVPTLS